MMNNVITRAEARQQIAEHILQELDLINRWSRFGSCNLVGSVAYRLVVAPDIDMEIICTKPGIEDGFDILRACALHSNVTKTRFVNALGPPHHGLYWQVRYQHEGEEWKIDMWSMADTILSLKEAVLGDASLECPSIQIYRAVLDSGVSRLDELKAWLPENPLTGVVTDWKPKRKT